MEGFSCMQKVAPDSSDVFENYDQEMLAEPRMTEPAGEPTRMIVAMREQQEILAAVKESQRQEME